MGMMSKVLFVCCSSSQQDKNMLVSVRTSFTGLKPLTQFCRCWNI